MEYRKSVTIQAPRDEVFAWHTRKGAFERLAPPWQPTTLIGTTGQPPAAGSTVELQVKVGPLWRPWNAIHETYIPGKRFTDRQVTGPFASWLHTHQFGAIDQQTTRLEDLVSYELPLGPLGALGKGYVQTQLERLFRYRHRVTTHDITRHQSTKLAPLQIAMTGSSGLVGSALTAFLRTGTHRVRQLVRQPTTDPDAIGWTPDTQTWPAKAFDGAQAVIHLAGENIASRRWSYTHKQQIRNSRIDGTRRLCETLVALPTPPETLITASAIGFYGDRGSVLLDETSDRGEGFLPEVCHDWEQATEPARKAGIRVVNLRLGIVLTPAGGALQQILIPFKLGMGGVLGSGKQFMSWVALDDVLGGVLHALADTRLEGPVNLVAPHPVTNREFTKVLGHLLGRPTLLPTPGPAMRLLFGEMADAMLLSGTRVHPTQLETSNFEFEFETLGPALEHVLGRTRTD